MDSLTLIVILAVVQGVAEFLPISSSGHLVVVAALLSPGEGQSLEVADVNIVLHGGTLLSILVFYWHRIWRLMDRDRRTLGLVAIATLPAAVCGVGIKYWAEELLECPLLAGAMLIVTGAVLLVTARMPKGYDEFADMHWSTALWIGVAQAAAILPGISRSGATIASGIGLGLSRDAAATFSFLIAIPAIAGASVLEINDMLSHASLQTPLTHLAIGAAVSFAVGLLALASLRRILRQGSIDWFAWWCIPLGTGVVIWQLLS